MTPDLPDGSALRVRHDIGTAVTVSVRQQELVSYVYGAEADPWECPAPFFHPIRTTAGNLVSAHRPHDHRWHKGLAMTISHLSGDNFWGGYSYVRDAGYRRLDNVGSLRHRAFSRFDAEVDRLDLTEQVHWHNARGRHWIEERRDIAVHDVDAAAGTWELTVATALTNVSGARLEIGSPTIFGREAAGYSGFFWRGPRDLTGGTILAAGGLEGPQVMGRRAAWLAYTGTHDVVDAASTLVVVPDPAAEDSPPVWFVRNEPFPAINPSLAFADEVTLPAGTTLRRRYRVMVADGTWDADRVEKYLKEHPW
ncbi:PmoA family protein [Micromonospora sp. DH14]|uniref:DUF6807 domain-containing protein n=1 Tax=Micromonospora sp. DH14 TaxID=3040120 RepID=UPI0024415172|nr:PmoA family protein [Micromonospora sp. DH14]MDG9674726.1 PmoA family protein [Micromonospora sp. DH14]